MAKVRISQLPNATAPLTGSEMLPVVQDNETRKVTVSDLFNGGKWFEYTVKRVSGNVLKIDIGLTDKAVINNLDDYVFVPKSIRYRDNGRSSSSKYFSQDKKRDFKFRCCGTPVSVLMGTNEIVLYNLFNRIHKPAFKSKDISGIEVNFAHASNAYSANWAVKGRSFRKFVEIDKRDTARKTATFPIRIALAEKIVLSAGGISYRYICDIVKGNCIVANNKNEQPFSLSQFTPRFVFDI